MAYFLFVDESGHDHRSSPYEVLAGISIKDSELWHMIRIVKDFEFECFGCRYTIFNKREIKARTFLNAKTFRLAAQLPKFKADERTELACSALTNGDKINQRELTALAQAKLAYVQKVLKLCDAFECKIFASIISDPSLVKKELTELRKDYVYLFQRFHRYLQDRRLDNFGVIIFDELEKSGSHLLVDQMDKYFKRSPEGNELSSLMIPEPFFVHSDLTTGIQIADFVAYILSWNFRYHDKLTKPKRDELDTFGKKLNPLKYRIIRQIDDEELYQSTLKVI